MPLFRSRSPWQYLVILVLAVVFYKLLGFAADGNHAPPAQPQRDRVSNAEPSFEDQLAAVRRGESVEIRLTHGSVGDEEARMAADVPGLERFNVARSELTDAGLAALSAAPNLTLLRIGSSHITDEGMKHVARMKNLRFLHLIDVPITDAGLEHLQEMTWLESFYLDGGQTTDDGLYALLKALPDLHFHKDQLHLPDDPSRHEHE